MPARIHHIPPVVVHPRPVTPALAELLEVARAHRLHPAMLLVGRYRRPAPLVLHLTWPRMALNCVEDVHGAGSIGVDEVMLELLYWHGCRQRVDRHRAGMRWWPSRRVFVDETGRPFTAARADRVVADFATQVGLPPLTLNALGHPRWNA